MGSIDDDGEAERTVFFPSDGLCLWLVFLLRYYTDKLRTRIKRLMVGGAVACRRLLSAGIRNDIPF